VVEAAKQAFAHEFIMALPEGFSTRVGEGGADLSGGQRQRLAIARAILKDAPILVLDKAISALDSQVEEAVYRALEHLMKGKTVLIVAHRESSLIWADNVQVAGT
jgi:ABC-type multidrug transport system fused ATPase/permease subunit